MAMLPLLKPNLWPNLNQCQHRLTEFTTNELQAHLKRGWAAGKLVSIKKVVIDNCPCFRKLPGRGSSPDMTRPCSQKSSRAWIYLYPPTRSVPDGGQGVSSILNIICARFGHGFIMTNVARTRKCLWQPYQGFR